MKLYETNKTGNVGVCKQGRWWRADVQENKKRKYLGIFDSKTAAIEAVRGYKDGNQSNQKVDKMSTYDQ